MYCFVSAFEGGYATGSYADQVDLRSYSVLNLRLFQH